MKSLFSQTILYIMASGHRAFEHKIILLENNIMAMYYFVIDHCVI